MMVSKARLKRSETGSVLSFSGQLNSSRPMMEGGKVAA